MLGVGKPVLTKGGVTGGGDNMAHGGAMEAPVIQVEPTTFRRRFKSKLPAYSHWCPVTYYLFCGVRKQMRKRAAIKAERRRAIELDPPSDADKVVMVKQGRAIKRKAV